MGHKPEMTKKSFCRFCLSFCGVEIDFDSVGKPVKVRGDRDHPVSKGYCCRKGRDLLGFYSKRRQGYPMCGGVRGTWDDSFTSLAALIKKVVAESGPDAVGLYAGTNAILDASGMWTALGFMYRLESKSIYSVTSVDAINKQLMIEQMTSFSTFGLIPQADFEHTDCLLIIGSNPVVSHGHLAGIPYPAKRIQNIKKRSGKVVVVDPRRTKTSEMGTHYFQPRPGTDYAWLGFVIRELLEMDSTQSGIDWDYVKQHTRGLDRLRESVSAFDLQTTMNITGFDVDKLEELVFLIRESPRISGITGTGVSFCDSGIVGEWFLWALLALKGSLDQRGGIWFNPGYTNDYKGQTPNIRTDSAWSTKAKARPDLPVRSGDLPVSGLADEVFAKNLRVLICIGGNPITAFPDSGKTRRALSELDALVVLDTHRCELVDLADYVYPVCGQLERSDSSVYAQQSVPMLSVLYTDPVLSPVGESKPVWWVLSKLGDELGLDVVKLGKPTDEISDCEVLETIKGAGSLVAKDSSLRTQGFVVDSDRPFGWVLNGVLPEKKWVLSTNALDTEMHRVLGDAISWEGFVLVSMRESYHLNSQFSSVVEENPVPRLFVNPRDAFEQGFGDGDLVELVTDVSTIQAQISLSDKILEKTVSISHGFSGSGNVSRLTSAQTVNPMSGMVSQTAIPVQKIYRVRA